MVRPLLFTLLAGSMLTACSVGPDYEAPVFSLPASWPWENPTNHLVTEQTPTAISADWWQQFSDETLTSLVTEGLQHNDDLRIAAARVAEYRGLLRGSRIDQYPDLRIQGDAGRTSNSEESSLSAGFRTSSKPYNSFSLAAVLDYEIDIWGRLSSASDAAAARLFAEQANRDTVRLAVASDIAGGYFNLLALDAQIIVTENTITARDEAYDYQSKQYREGAADTLTFKQAEAELAAARAQLPILQQARYEQQTALGVLLGRQPKELAESLVKSDKIIDALPNPPALPADLPSSLLERRPDIASAEQSLIAANADISVAKADYFPRLSLSALLGLGSTEAGDLLSSSARKWSAGAALAQPLVGLLKTDANVDSALARKEQAVAQYELTVRGAFKDVLDSLSAIRTGDARIDAETAHTNARSDTLQQAQLRYQAGYSNYLEVLDAQRFLYQAQLDRITAKRDRLNASVNLYKALGGGWQAESLKTETP